MRMGDKV